MVRLASVALAAFCGLAILSLLLPGVCSHVASAATQPTPVVSVTTLPALPSTAPAATFVPSLSPQSTSTPSPAAPIPTAAAAPGTAIAVTGDVGKPLVLSLDQLRNAGRGSLTLRVVDPDGRHRFHTYTGVPLRSVIDAAQPRDHGGTSTSTRAFAVISGISGSSAIIAFPEFENDFANRTVLLAYLIDGKPAQSGIAQLVVQGDATSGRFVQGVSRIEVVEAGP